MNKYRLLLSLFFLQILLLNIVTHFAVAASTTNEVPSIRVMPLGYSDYTSIINEPADGYIETLYQNLTELGYNIDILGKIRDISPTGKFLNDNNETYIGWTIGKFIHNIEEILDRAKHDPDVILLNVGFNDFELGFEVENTINELSELLTKISTLRPAAHIITSNLIHRYGETGSKIQTHFNPFVESIINNYKVQGKRITFLDLEHQIDPEIFARKDSVQLNRLGYQKMGEAWADAIRQIFIEPEGDQELPHLVGAKSSMDRQSIDIIFSKPISDFSGENLMNFDVGQGLKIFSSSLNQDKRVVTLTTPLQSSGITYIVTVNGIQDRTQQKLELLPNSTVTFIVGWRFIILPDLHIGKKYTLSSNAEKHNAIANDVLNIKVIKQRYGGDLIMVSRTSYKLCLK